MGHPEPPVGTIALLFTDVEGSTRLATKLGSGWPGVLAQHHGIVADAITAEGGFVDHTEGDAFFATFTDPAAAARAAVAVLRGLRAHEWPAEVGELNVRIGLHVGFVERPETGYVGLEVHRAARVAAAAHGGQLLLTASAHELIGDAVRTESVGLHRLKDFPAPVQLFCAVVDGRGAASFPPPRTQSVRPTNLPAGNRQLVGRDDELSQLRLALLEEGERMVTISGRGGAGKTSLALLAGVQLLDNYYGGVWWANLAAVTSSKDVLGAVAAALGAERDVAGTVQQALQARLVNAGPTLVMLDNMEHLLGAAGVLNDLLDSLPQLSLLITSQAPLRVPAERVIALDALDDQAGLDLIERVTRRRGGRLEAAGTDREALLDVVHLLDGLPLALELAAARLSLLSAAQLRDRLRESSDVLKDSGGGRPERQRSLRATVQWSLGLLDESARALFVRLGAFAGPAELEDLEAVAGGDGLDVLEALATLLDVALIRRVESGDGRVRFGLPEALRQIASDLLDATSGGQTWRYAHAQRFYELVWAGRSTFADRTAFERAYAVDAEAAQALRWARRHGHHLAEPIGAARGSLMAIDGRLRESMSVLAPLIESPPADSAVRSLALTAYCLSAAAAGRASESIAIADEAVQAGGGPESECLAVMFRGVALLFDGRFTEALRDHARATEIARGLGPAALAAALIFEAQAQLTVGAVDTATQRLTEARQVGGPADASSLRYLDTQEGDLAMALGHPLDALEPYARSLESAQARNDALQVLFDLRGMANALGGAGRDEDAVEVYAMAEMQAQEVGGIGGMIADHLQGGGIVVQAAARLGDTAAAEATARGRAVAAGYRVARACGLARARQPA